MGEVDSGSESRVSGLRAAFRKDWGLIKDKSTLSNFSGPKIMFEQRLDGAKRKADRYRYTFTLAISLVAFLMASMRVF